VVWHVLILSVLVTATACGVAGLSIAALFRCDQGCFVVLAVVIALNVLQCRVQEPLLC